MFVCKKCKAKFEYYSYYERHISRISSCVNDPFACLPCNKIYQSKSALNKHLSKCVYKLMDNQKKDLQGEFEMRLQHEIGLLKNAIIKHSGNNITINGDVDINNNNNTVINKLSKREKYTHVFPLGKFKTDVVLNICVENARICDKLKIALGKGDVINPVLIIYKAVHMNSTYNEYKNVSYKDGQFMAVVENQGWIPVSWEFICEKMDPEIDIVLRRAYDKMEYKSKKGNRAKDALESFYKMSIADIKELKNKVKETSTRVFNNHNIVGIISAESSKSSTDSYEYDSESDSDSYESDDESS